MMKKFLLFFIILLISVSLLPAQNVRFNGFGNVGYIFYNQLQPDNSNQTVYYEGKLKTNIELGNKIQGQVYFKGSSIDNSVKLQELTVQFTFSDFVKVKIGNAKKPFGYEYLLGEEELLTIKRSFVQENIAELGYGGFAPAITCYHKYSKNQPEFPFSYYVSVFRDDALFSGVLTRFSYHVKDIGVGINYMIESKSGDQKITTQGFGGGFFLENGIYNGMLELFFVQDPYESIYRKLQGNENKAASLGVKFFSSYNFKMDEEFLKGIEPVVLVSYFNPDNAIKNAHTIQIIGGANFYLHEHVRARVNADVRLTKTQFAPNYKMEDSRLILTLQMTF